MKPNLRDKFEESKERIKHYWNIRVNKVDKFLNHCLNIFKKHFYSVYHFFFFYIDIVLKYIQEKRDLWAKYEEIRKKNVDFSVKQCIEGIGGLKNIVKVSATINTLRIRVYFLDLVSEEKIRKCSNAGVLISGNFIYLIAGVKEAKDICKKLKELWEKSENLFKTANLEHNRKHYVYGKRN